jgi:hypothetical protein
LKKLSSLQAPVGQGNSGTKSDKKTKTYVRYEIDQSQNTVKQRDVHAGTTMNPMIANEVNQEDPQVMEMQSNLNQSASMGNTEADAFIEKYAK